MPFPTRNVPTRRWTVYWKPEVPLSRVSMWGVSQESRTGLWTTYCLEKAGLPLLLKRPGNCAKGWSVITKSKNFTSMAPWCISRPQKNKHTASKKDKACSTFSFLAYPLHSLEIRWNGIHREKSCPACTGAATLQSPPLTRVIPFRQQIYQKS